MDLIKCPSCGYENDENNLTCSMCGAVLKRVSKAEQPVKDEIIKPVSKPSSSKKYLPWLVIIGIIIIVRKLQKSSLQI